MNNVISVPDIGPKLVLKPAVAHNVMEVGSFVARPFGYHCLMSAEGGSPQLIRF